MRIISDEKDYYDCIQRLGVDDELIYVRKEKYIGPVKFPILLLPKFRIKYNDPRWFYYGVIGFAGKIYPYIHIVQREYDPYEGVHKTIHDTFSYDKESFYHTCPDLKDKYSNIDNYFNSDEWSKTEVVNYFSKNSPIFVISRDRKGHDNSLTFNPTIKSYEFAKVLDPYSAYQELRMWLSNQAEPRKSIPDESDIDKAERHGFNKQSFRLPKGAKPNRKNKIK